MLGVVDQAVVDAGNACAAFHDEHVCDVRAARVQAGEIWSRLAFGNPNW